MAQVIPYDIKRWLLLGESAAVAADKPHLPSPDLATQAGRLASVTLPNLVNWERAAFNALRWSCQAYGLVPDALTRARMAPGLAEYAAIVRSILKPDLDPDPEPGSGALADPAWLHRADTGTE